jgi:hypothetical protein
MIHRVVIDNIIVIQPEQEINLLLWNKETHYGIHMIQPLNSNLYHMNIVLTLILFFPEIHCHITLPLRMGRGGCDVWSGFEHRTLCDTSLRTPT